MIPRRVSHEERAFSSHVLAHLKSFATVIDVARFINSYRWSMQQVMDLYMEVLWDNPEIFYVAKSASIDTKQYGDGSVKYAKLTGIQYAFPKSEYQRNVLLLENEVKKAVRYAAGETAPERIALRLHDYIVQVCDYDTAAADTNDLSPRARSVYSVLVRKKAVCEGYTMAYRYLLSKFNIPCEEVISDEMNHVWNYVNIRNRWYHVDVTYDDPVFVDTWGMPLRNLLDPFGSNTEISREHFLMSDAKARRKGHCGWDTKGLPPASDTSFDNVRW